MVEHAADFEWRGEGEEAEISLYAPDETVAEASFERVLPTARLPGVLSPIYAATSGTSRGFGWVAASETHAARTSLARRSGVSCSWPRRRSRALGRFRMRRRA
jgi:hypothetical protein